MNRRVLQIIAVFQTDSQALLESHKDIYHDF